MSSGEEIEVSRFRLGDLSDAVKQQAEAWGCSVTQALHRLLRLGLSVDELAAAVRVGVTFRGGPLDGKLATLEIARDAFVREEAFAIQIDGSPYRIVHGPVLTAVARMVAAGQVTVPDTLCLLAMFAGDAG